jgi:hypothetical protein
MEFIYTEHIDINIEELKDILLNIEKEILHKFENIERPNFGKGSKITNYWNLYNLSERSEPIIQQLFSKLKQKIIEKWEVTRNMKICAWINVHKKGENLFWHGHNRYMKDECIHGYFCVEVEPSQTIYVFSGQDDLIEINNKNSCLVACFGNNNFLHKVTKWERDCERITIGFNMVPLIRTHENLVPGSQ